ncbi:uncharacterized protein LOC122070999 [Macadamia integrifolia]|uniref:uncharacterized protein LOC122070999 n=1 Tax=Macadamia integrifolia TaxID=60698 RepID=UPI001C4F266F|nr:uncharacterized protein LOC122070999 [Macadamia integrifolia]XP_042491199.1 uncharacterized protein LOC122070999 [Macadamia integrifolia]XP_042491200.1 uncharacterized protein LOC122070999 [Macadamia integrifolia]XP_042491201.1 uncharacterized protein LOC122070999 [Macadamia integrifolia]XP_042491202.1 uncharacterized protein LOC122070999 [Macadamia integrifolia]XP_042491203.1 uncharacterized protein LOC122070999 [Macadamia integrifolia]XP_042491204.1 uncharacterized protein LOC122070999 [
MDGNMLEAFREKEIAEMMMVSNNYSGARDKLLKAKDLFPSLDNIAGMLTVCDILCAANVGLSGYSTDWYWILQLKPGADESTIESQYCKLINLLEPIKNEFPGTVASLKLIKKAFSVLSDREKRAEFDMKRLGDCWAYGSDLQEQPDMEVVKGKREAISQSSSGWMKISSDTFGVTNELSFPRKHHKVITSKGVTESGVQNALIDTGKEAVNNIKTEATSQSSSGWMKISSDTFDVTNELSCPRKHHKVITSKDVTESGVQNALIGTGKEPIKNISIFGAPKSKISAPETDSNGGAGSRSSQRNPSRSLCKMPDSDYYNFNNNRKAEAFSVGQVWAAYDQENMPRRYHRICGFIMKPFQLRFTCLKPIPGCADEKKWCAVGLPVACGAFELDMGAVMVGGASKFSHVVSQVATVTEQPVEIYPRKGEVWAIYRDWEPFEWCKDPKTRKGYRLQIVEIVASFSKQAGVRVVCLEKVDGFRNIFQRHQDNGSKSCFQIPGTHSYTFSHIVPAFRFAGGEMNGISAGMFELDPLAVPAELVQGMAKPLGKENSSDCSTFTHSPSTPTAIMSEPEGEALKSKWTAKDFVSDKIWAIYDGPDSMPRQYVRIKNLISRNEVCVTLLKPYPILGDEVQWVKESLPFVCGLFQTDRVTCNFQLSRFSHLVKCERSKDKSFYKVYPKKGEIWAMYRNWNSKWTRSNYNGCCCRIVEVLSDFSEESGLRVASLVEVTGFLTFFQRQLDDGYELLRTVSTREMLSFSHQIPAFIVAGSETHDLPKGCLHLEPDALPSKLSN